MSQIWRLTWENAGISYQNTIVSEIIAQLIPQPFFCCNYRVKNYQMNSSTNFAVSFLVSRRASIGVWDAQVLGLAIFGQPLFSSMSPCTRIPEHLMQVPNLIDFTLPVLFGGRWHILPPHEHASLHSRKQFSLPFIVKVWHALWGNVSCENSVLWPQVQIFHFSGYFSCAPKSIFGPPILHIFALSVVSEEFGHIFRAPENVCLRPSGFDLVAHDCGYPLSRYTCRATRVAADFLDFIAFCRCSTGVALHPLKILVSHLPPPVPAGVAPKFGSEEVSRYTGVSQLQLRVSRYAVQLRSSIEIENFERDWILLIVGPSGQCRALFEDRKSHFKATLSHFSSP